MLDSAALVARDSRGSQARYADDAVVLGRSGQSGLVRTTEVKGVSPRTRRTDSGTSWAAVCKLALTLPGVTEGTSYGTPALHVCRRFLARLKEDGVTMAIRMDFADREVLLEMEPSIFFLTDHYRPYPAVLVRLAKAPAGLVAQLLEQAWRFQAPKSMAKRVRSEIQSRAAAHGSPGAAAHQRRARG